MSDCEQFAQIAQEKWATMSESLRLLKKMSYCEQFAQVAQDKWANEQFAQKMLSKKSKILFFSMFYIGFFL